MTDDLTYYAGPERDMADALETYFGEDFTGLPGATRLALIADCWTIRDEPEFADVDYAGTLAQEYRDRIGADNLRSYAACFGEV